MVPTVTIDLRHVARGLSIPLRQVQAVVELLDEGNTVPFITRYRKDRTGGLDEEQVRQVQSRLAKTRLLADRKQTILRSIESQGRLTEKLAAQICAAGASKRLEDLYLPFRPKRQTLALVARSRGLEPLAREILQADEVCADLDARAADFVDPDREVPTAADAVLGAGHILAEQFSERADLRQRLREIFWRTGKLACTQAEVEQEGPGEETEKPSQKPDKVPEAPEDSKAEPSQPDRKPKLGKTELRRKRAEEKKIKAFRDYFDYREEIKKIPPHRILAINRGERAKVLRVKIKADLEAMHKVLDELLLPPDHQHGDYLRGCARDALSRLILPNLERELRRELTDRAEVHAVGVFARNLRNLLLQPPVRDRRVLAFDPGYRSGCKLAALDQFGNLLEHAVIFLVGRPERRKPAQRKVIELIERYQLSVVAIGNGTACRECEDFVAELLAGKLKDRDVAYVVVNEAGASVYSTSRVGREEFPGYDASLRGAISIGRRLQDPLSELVKIDAANIGVGLYQHDVKAKHLRASLDDVVESCVNYVGVDLNTASPALLRYVSGLNQLTARRLCEHRRENGPFRNREQLREVPGFGEATFVQAAGFLKIAAGDNPLDATWIHPESYEAADRVLSSLQCAAADLTDKEKTAALAERVANVDLEETTKQLDVGLLTLKDILVQLARPGRDPRENLPAPLFKKGVLKLDDLRAGMELTGTVLNVVDFGAFVDIGMHDSGLVHVSQLADKFVRNPHEVVVVGDIVKVWVIEVDKERRRVSLTMIQPGTERPQRAARGKKQVKSDDKGRAQRSAEGGSSRDQKRTRTRQSDRSKSKGLRTDAGPRRKRGPPKPKYRPTPRPKPVVPITDAMKSGKEPLRTFGDLAQFLEHQSESQDGENSQDEEQTAHDEKRGTEPEIRISDETLTVEDEAESVQDTAQSAPQQGERNT